MEFYIIHQQLHIIIRLLDVEYATRDIIEYRTIANGYLSFNLMDGLKWRNEFGFDLYNLKENARYGETY